MSDLTLKLRPDLDRWLRDRGLGVSALAERWRITPQGASRYLLPFEHPRRIVPTEAQMADVLDWTGGEVTAAHWYPPHLRPVVGAGAPSKGAA